MYLVNPHELWLPPDSSGQPYVRLREAGDAPAIRELMARAYPPPHGPEAVWSEALLLKHLQVFPGGQWVACAANGRVVGSATSMRIGRDLAFLPHTWTEITGRGLLSTHDPDGEVLYGVNIVVDPDFQGQGHARRLYEARLATARRLGCRWMVAGARIPGYVHHAGSMTARAYVAAVVAGSISDPTLTKQLRVGFKVLGVLDEYAPDPETLGHAALIGFELEGSDAL